MDTTGPSELKLAIVQGPTQGPTKASYASFAARTLAWVALQLLLTSGVVGWMCVHRAALSPYLAVHPWAFWTPVGCTFLFLLGMYATERPTRLVLFVLFGAALSWVIGAGAVTYSPRSVLTALGVTALVVATSAAYSAYCVRTNISLEGLGPSLAPILAGVCLVGIAGLFFRSPLLDQILAGVSVALFTAYLIYDLEQLYARLEPGSLELEDPIYAAANIYLDIVNIFVGLLELLGQRE
jgi:FtsH-binding integral membrane protein